MLIKRYSLITVNVLYYLPDYHHIINEFIWQTVDLPPTYPRIGKFLNFWRTDIDAVIKEIMLCGDKITHRKFKNVDEIFRLN